MLAQKSTRIRLTARSRSPYVLWMIWVMWLPFLLPDMVQWLHSSPSLPRLITTCGVLALFISFYLWTTLQNAKRLINGVSWQDNVGIWAWLSTAVFLVLSAMIAWLASEHGFAWLSPFIFTVAYTGGRFPLTRALPVIAGIVLFIVLVGWLIGLSAYGIGSSLFYIVIVGLAVVALMRVVQTNGELRAAREEIERLAVTAERLRIARDLHDVLGHNLALIALKSELARRLVSIAPERATSEISDIEQVARTTLQEVREAVANYRQPTLGSELEAAQEILAAAGIQYKYQGHEYTLTDIPPAVEAILSWTVREGVTNVIKHSRAHHCLIALTRDEQTIGVEIADDGRALSSVDEHAGNGLRGLAERVNAYGGQFEAASRPIGGFRLAVTLPLASQYVDNEATASGVLHMLSERADKSDQKREEER